MKNITPRRGKIITLAIGIVLIIAGFFLIGEMLLKFLRFALGFLLIIIGLQFISWRR